ncbi:MAG: hypothetical protein WBA93_23985 [Microcoleaceae cyanobacterium]
MSFCWVAPFTKTFEFSLEFSLIIRVEIPVGWLETRNPADISYELLLGGAVY